MVNLRVFLKNEKKNILNYMYKYYYYYYYY